MNPGGILAIGMACGLCACAIKETKLAVDQTPEAVRATVQRELIGAQLEDIAKTKVKGQTAYETDIIRDGHKWEVVVGKDGAILSKRREDAVAETATGTQRKGAWLDRFDINKADLLPTGTNAYIPMQPGRVLTLKNGIDTLTVTVLSDTQLIDGVTAGILEERETKDGKLVEVSRNFLA